MNSLAITNAHIWTGRGPAPWARSMIVHGDTIAAIDAPIPDGTVVIDARGRTVIPGVIDAHLHLLMGGLQLGQLDLSDVDSRSAFEASIADRHAQLPDNAWLVAHGWNEANWDASEGMPTSDWLRAAGDRPVVCYRSDIHAAVVSASVLEMCASESDPPGGAFATDAKTQRRTGLVVEAALWNLVNSLIPEASVSEKQNALRRAIRHCHGLGITTVGAMEYAVDVSAVMQPLADGLNLRVQVTLLDHRTWPMSFDFAMELRHALVSAEMLNIIGCKAFTDGTLGSRTAYLLAPYSDDPGNHGTPVELGIGDDLSAWAQGVVAAGFSPSVHAIGDAAAKLTIGAFGSLDRGHPTTRPRLEHAQQLDADDVHRMRGLCVSMQPLHKADDARIAVARLGVDRLDGFFAFRKLADAGADLAFGSDWPVVSCDPFLGMRTAITGWTFNEESFRTDANLTIDETLAAYTEGAARALGLDHVGRLLPGMKADFVVLDEDPFDVDWEAGELPTVDMTFVAGECVYEQS